MMPRLAGWRAPVSLGLPFSCLYRFSLIPVQTVFLAVGSVGLHRDYNCWGERN